MTARTYSQDDRAHAMTRLAMAGGNVSAVSRDLGIPRPTLIAWRDTIVPDLKPPPPSPPQPRQRPARPPTLADTVAATADTVRERVVAEIEMIAFGNLGDVATWDSDGQFALVPSHEMSPAQHALVSEIRYKRRRETSGRGADAQEWTIDEVAIKTRDKLRALQLLAEITGLASSGGVNVTVDARSQTAVARLTDEQLDRLIEATEPMDDGDSRA